MFYCVGVSRVDQHYIRSVNMQSVCNRANVKKKQSDISYDDFSKLIANNYFIIVLGIREMFFGNAIVVTSLWMTSMIP